ACVRCGGGGDRWLARAVGEGLQNVRPYEFIDELMAPSVSGVQRTDIDQLLQARLSPLVRPHIGVGIDVHRGEFDVESRDRSLERVERFTRDIVPDDD